MDSVTETKKITIVYLAYNLETIKYQAIISIFSLYHHISKDNGDFLFVIYTDSNTGLFDKYLKGLPVKLEVLSKEQASTFLGPSNYIFRLKPSIIRDCFTKYKRNILYMDTDTFFLRNPIEMLSGISKGHTIMNVKEYDFIDGGMGEYLHWFHLRQALKRYKYTVHGQEIAIPLSTMMWNAGIIGISYSDASLIDDVIQLIDEMYGRAKTFIVEQFVASYILQTNTELRSSEDYIQHYWSKDIKNTFNLRIPTFLKENEGKSGQELFDSAFIFATQASSIRTPIQTPVTTRIADRIKLIFKVARKGYI
ncbi:hypothetical protein [Hymenobacter rubidus]|uniref:hypothetical protein n=1 Tax=Hymenobacter rubidus TaxID=1441626 RepID=UPI00191F4979|nr:hypothetical protein [Hymenobacter rubidus]